MAIYRNISLTFWTDNKVSDDFTSKDKYFFLYLLTNPHTNIIGCYEISIRQMSIEMGLNIKEIEELVDRAQTIHKTILYSKQTKEVLIKNWSRYNWTKSSKLQKPIIENINLIKDLNLKKLLVEIAKKYGIDTVSIGYLYPMDTTDTVTVTDTVTDYFNNINDLINFIQKDCNYILFGTPIETNTIQLWLENKIDLQIIKKAFVEAKRRNKNDINYINKIIENTLKEIESKKESDKKPDIEMPNWFNKKVEKKEENLGELEEILKDFE